MPVQMDSVISKLFFWLSMTRSCRMKAFAQTTQSGLQLIEFSFLRETNPCWEKILHIGLFDHFM